MENGKISFQFNGTYLDRCEKVFSILRKCNTVGCLVYPTDGRSDISYARLRQMQEEGWEIMTFTNLYNSYDEQKTLSEISKEMAESKEVLEKEGLSVHYTVVQGEKCDASLRSLLQKHYEGSFVDKMSEKNVSLEGAIIKRPFNRFALRRVFMRGKTREELKAYVDFACKEKEYIVLYADETIAEDVLEYVVKYCKDKDVNITTVADSMASEKCRVKIISDGYDGKTCFVHARVAANENQMLITAQKMDVSGSDCFEAVQTKFSQDGGKTWTDFTPDEGFAVWYHDDLRTACSDMTPMYHKKTGKFLVTGSTVDYERDSVFPVHPSRRTTVIPYAVFDTETQKFKKRMQINLPDREKYACYSSGCCQCYELENGDVLIPVFYRAKAEENLVPLHKVTVIRCSFDGEELRLLEIGNDLEMPDERRGLAEPSLTCFKGTYYCTIRADGNGYIATSQDGLHYTSPKLWTWDNGEILPTYGTQAHWLRSSDSLYLVYTRKNGENDHVFRHRAPLYAAKVNTEKLAVIRDSEFVVIPERGARLGNFGAFSDENDTMYVIASEWMQPSGCEAYGSNNALWLADVTIL